MYIDVIVVVGIVIVLLMLGFFVGVVIFVIRDEKLYGLKGRLKKCLEGLFL